MDIGRKGFADSADVYERGRPGYPEALIGELCSRLGVGSGAAVLDLGAGTGKLSRQLVSRGMDVSAVEPSEDMRRVLATSGARALEGSAEAIPLAAASVQAAFCGQAFHWFATAAALTEIARVLEPGGGLALIWNAATNREPELAALMDKERLRSIRPENRHDTLLWMGAFDEVNLFGSLEKLEAEHTQHLSAADYVAQVASRSYMAIMPKDERVRVMGEIARSVGDRDVTIHYRTEAWFTRKRS